MRIYILQQRLGLSQTYFIGTTIAVDPDFAPYVMPRPKFVYTTRKWAKPRLRPGFAL
jgi:hypothetical protein